jgi:hypothetical protein
MVQEYKREIANHPLERKIWFLRKFYAGNGGVLPPTDPRILSMTKQQIDIEFEHIIIDKEERAKDDGNKVYVDDSYEEAEAEEERIDRKLYIEPDPEDEDYDPYLPKSENDDEGEWVDDETDDDDEPREGW